MLVPFFLHWYAGVVPPFTGVAVKVTEVPAQMAPAGTAAMPTLAGSRGLMVMATVLDVAGLPDAHVRLDVTTT
jgi:hypothetical protein